MPARTSSARFLRVLTLILAAIAGIAVARKFAVDEPAEEWRGTREVIDGIEVVRNPGAPLLKAGAVEVEKLWTVDGEAGQMVSSTDANAGAAMPSVWAEPSRIRQSGAVLYLLDPMESRVYVLDAEDGGWLHSIGRKGRGPGELDHPRDLAVLDGRLVVSSGGGAFEVFAEDGAHLSTISTGGVTFGGYPLDGGGVLGNTLLGMEARWRIYRLDGAIDTLPNWPVSVAIPGGEVEGGVLECQRTGTAGAFILRSSCAIPHILQLDAEGRLLREFTVEREPDIISDAEREAEIERVRESVAGTPGIPPAMIQRVVQIKRDESRIRRSFRAVREDPDTGVLAIWEQNPDELGGGTATLHLFSDSGIYLAEVPFDRAWVDFDLAGSKLFALERDPETDLVSATAYRMVVPEVSIEL